ncbi:MAG: hypothetical protein M0C28_30160 [Candidatus Moduliflexus flocculans]|nr:hypothetical protein [Candidatus Moduliflexus flocculans]
METLFAASRKPVLAVGLGAVRAGAGVLVAQVAERHRVPVVLTPMAKGLLSEDHPWYAGVLFHAALRPGSPDTRTGGPGRRRRL